MKTYAGIFFHFKHLFNMLGFFLLVFFLSLSEVLSTNFISKLSFFYVGFEGSFFQVQTIFALVFIIIYLLCIGMIKSAGKMKLC